MPLTIPIQAVPAQTVLCVLGGQNCQIAIYQRNESIYVDLTSNSVDMCIGALALNAVPLDACNSYNGFQGNLYIIDTQGSDDPLYTGLGARWVLVYLTASENILTAFTAVGIPNILQLVGTLLVTAPNAGTFSIAHGLSAIPSVIEIVPTSAAAIWGDLIFADATNINLEASVAGATSIVLIYQQPTLSEVTKATPLVQTPAATLTVAAPSYAQFTVPHGLGAIPSLIEILPTSFGWIWESAPADNTNLYFQSSVEGTTATIYVFQQINTTFNLIKWASTQAVTSSGPGPFSFAHGLAATPSRIQILMLSGGQIIAGTPAFDATNVYLSASETGMVALISVYA